MRPCCETWTGTRPQRLVELARQVEIHFQDDRVLLDGQDVSAEIRTPEITAVTHWAANNPGVREHLVGLQRQMAGSDDIVTEGATRAPSYFPRPSARSFSRPARPNGPAAGPKTCAPG